MICGSMSAVIATRHVHIGGWPAVYRRRQCRRCRDRFTTYEIAEQALRKAVQAVKVASEPLALAQQLLEPKAK